MEGKKGKSLEQLQDKVHQGLEALSDEELVMLFDDANDIADQVEQQETVPSPAPASAKPAPPAEETPKGQADLMNLVPDKFKGEDEAASLAKMIKTLQEQEAALTQRSQEVSQLQNVVQELSRKPVVREEYRPDVPKAAEKVKASPEPEEIDVDDLGFLDAPVNNSVAIATKVAKQVAEEVARRISIEQLRDYDTFALRRNTFDKFRLDHPDFDSIREEFSQACRLHPEWDNDVNGLPKLYDLAKTLAKAKGVTPAVTPAQSTPSTPNTLDIAKLKAELKAEVEASVREQTKKDIFAEITRRKAAAGIVSGSSTTTPAERVTPSNKTVQLTPEEKAIQDMLDSGPKGISKDLNAYGDLLSFGRPSDR